jgi:PAS domain S-box-containing protein
VKNRDNLLEEAIGLHRQAEEIARAKVVRLPVNFKAPSSEEQRIIHELHGYQVELKIQNEDLLRTQSELEAARSRYFDLYDLAPVGYCTLSEKGLILEANLTTATLLGMARSELARQPITRFILKKDQDIYYRHRKQLFETDEPQACELQMVRQEGTIFWARLEATAAQDADGAPVSRIVLSDITVHKLAALSEMLKNQNEIFSQILNSLDALIFVIDMKTHEIVFINTYGQNIWGDIKGKICWQAFHPGYAGPCEHCSNGRLIGPDGKPAESIAGEIQNTFNKRWYDCRDRAIYWPDGRIVRMEIATDITDRKRVETEKAKIESLDRQLQKSECMGRMAEAIAHNFNNQLHVVMGNLEMAMDGLPPDATPVKNLTSAMQAARKASEVSTLMLTYLGQIPDNHERIDLSEACRQGVPLLQAAVPNGTIIKADFPSIGPVIRANAGQIMQTLTNLITNAWESADKSRRGIGLTVKTVYAADIPAFPRFPVDWHPRDSDYACLEVADAGCGIAENDIEKIFDPFFSTKFTGRGMGLPIVLGIVRAHHGAVTVESEPGLGSIFRLFFPLSIEEVLQRPDKAAQAPKNEDSGTVLLVEDEEMVREITADTLRYAGFAVLEAKDGIDAVEVFRQHRNEIRCVLSDLMMPRMDGWETLTAIRNLSPDIPFVLSSGYDEAHVMSGDHPERPNAFLGKPYRLQDLRDTISRTLAGQKTSG